MSVAGALVGVVIGLAILAVILWYLTRYRPEAKRRAEMQLRAEMGEGNRSRSRSTAGSVHGGVRAPIRRTVSSVNPTFARQAEAWVTFSAHPRSLGAVKAIITELGKLGIPANRCYYLSEPPPEGKSTEKTMWSVASNAGFVVACLVGTEYVWSRPLCHQWRVAADNRRLVLNVDTDAVIKQALRSASVQHTGKMAVDTGAVRDFYSTGGQGENLVEGDPECQSSRSIAITIIEHIMTFVPPPPAAIKTAMSPEVKAKFKDATKNRHLECVKLVYASLPERVWEGIACTHPELREMVAEATVTEFIDDPYEDAVSPDMVAARLARDQGQARRMPQESLYDTPHDDSLPMTAETPPPKPPLPNTVTSGAGRSGARQTAAPASPGGYKNASAIAVVLESVDDVAVSGTPVASYVNAGPFLEQQHRDQAATQSQTPKQPNQQQQQQPRRRSQQQQQQQQPGGESYDNHVPFKTPPGSAGKRATGQAAAFSGGSADARLAGGKRRPKSSGGAPQSRGAGQTAAFGAKRPPIAGGARPKSLGSSAAEPSRPSPVTVARPIYPAAPTDAPPRRGTLPEASQKSPGVVYLDHKREAAVGPPGVVYIEHNPNYGAVGDDTDV